jgi:hypothetical protein
MTTATAAAKSHTVEIVIFSGIIPKNGLLYGWGRNKITGE